MICYKDMTWCPFGDCKDAEVCEIFLSRDVEKRANNYGLPVSIFIERPPCYVDGNVIDINIE